VGEGKSSEGVRVVTTLRLLPRVRDKLQAAASLNDVSTAQEVERRLEQSFREEETAGGAERAALLRLIGTVVSTAERRYGGMSFFDDHATALAVRAALNTVLDEVMPVLDQPLAEKHAELLASGDFDANKEIRSRTRRGETLLDQDLLAIRMRHRRNMERQVIPLEPALREAVAVGSDVARQTLDQGSAE
jgi:hypothetical protein